MPYNKTLSKEQALQKIKQYCSYQERCHREVKTKLYTYGLYKRDVDEIIANIIENNYLNEERYAIHFAGGKFRINHWGRKKIQYALQQKGVSSFIIKIALKELNEPAYLKTIHTLASGKWNSLATERDLIRQAKTQAYLLQKGFEPALISQAIKTIRSAD